MVNCDQPFPVETLLWSLIALEIKSEPARVHRIQSPSPAASVNYLRAGTRGATIGATHLKQRWANGDELAQLLSPAIHAYRVFQAGVALRKDLLFPLQEW